MSTRGWEKATGPSKGARIDSGRRSKFNAKRTEVDGITFASKAEARRYSELRLMEKAGKISALVLQPTIPLMAASVDFDGEPCWVPTFVANYVADFRYRDTATDKVVWEDVKGFKTPVYRLKKKFAEACTGVEIKEIR